MNGRRIKERCVILQLARIEVLTCDDKSLANGDLLEDLLVLFVSNCSRERMGHSKISVILFFLFLLFFSLFLSLSLFRFPWLHFRLWSLPLLLLASFRRFPPASKLTSLSLSLSVNPAWEISNTTVYLALEIPVDIDDKISLPLPSAASRFLRSFPFPICFIAQFSV